MSVMGGPGAGIAPGGIPPGMGQPQSPMPPIPGAAPPPQLAPGGIPPMATPMAPPAQAKPSGVPPTSVYTDLSAKMPHAFQLLDAANRTIDMAIETGGFYDTPKALAAVRKVHEMISRIIRAYAEPDEQQSPPRPSNVSDGAGFDPDTLGGDYDGEQLDD